MYWPRLTIRYQVEYASKAVEVGGTAIGIRCKNGVVLAVEKIITSKLLKPGANQRIASIDRNFGMVRHHQKQSQSADAEACNERGRLTDQCTDILRLDSRRTAFSLTRSRRSFLLADELQEPHSQLLARLSCWKLRASVHSLQQCQTLWGHSHSCRLGLRG